MTRSTVKKAQQAAIQDLQENSTALSTQKTRKEKSIWTEQDEAVLIKFLLDCRAEAGDGANFKASTWNGAAEHLQKHGSGRGGPKTPRSCRDKWSRIKATHEVAQALTEQSGFTWDPETGATIDFESDAVWKAYVKKHPAAAPFRSKGWVHYEDAAAIISSKAKGSRAFHPGTEDIPEPGSAIQKVNGSSNESFDKNDVDTRAGLSEPPNPNAALSPPPPSQPVKPMNKRSHSLISASRSNSPASSPTSRVNKRSRLSRGAAAMDRLREELSEFNSVFRFAALQTLPGSSSDDSPVRKRMAMERAQELEDGLDDDQLATLLDIFLTDAGAADVYMVIKPEFEGLRKAWVRNKLLHLFPHVYYP